MLALMKDLLGLTSFEYASVLTITIKLLVFGLSFIVLDNIPLIVHLNIDFFWSFC